MFYILILTVLIFGIIPINGGVVKATPSAPQDITGSNVAFATPSNLSTIGIYKLSANLYEDLNISTVTAPNGKVISDLAWYDSVGTRLGTSVFLRKLLGGETNAKED